MYEPSEHRIWAHQNLNRNDLIKLINTLTIIQNMIPIIALIPKIKLITHHLTS